MGIAVVTGAGRGLGRAIAGRLAENGHDIVAVDIDGSSADKTAAELGGKSRQCDVTDIDAVRALAADVGPVDILINNAGIWRFGPLIEATAEDIDAVMRVNLLGTLHGCQAFSPGMAERGGGAIVNLSSAAAITRSPGIQIYPVTKGAVETLTGQLALELGPLGIRVNAVGPGLIVTEGTAPNFEGERRAQRALQVPLRRVCAPADIANAVAFLASDQASYVSGQTLYVDGGVSAGRPAI
jgi:3-oxoacyl-[acyl-carrier protein] reductase